MCMCTYGMLIDHCLIFFQILKTVASLDKPDEIAAVVDNVIKKFGTVHILVSEFHQVVLNFQVFVLIQLAQPLCTVF